MDTTTLERPATVATKSTKSKKGAHPTIAAMAEVGAKKGKAPGQGVSKADVKEVIAANAADIKAKATVVPPADKATKAKAKSAAPVKAKAEPKAKKEPKAKPEPKPRKVSAMWVIRTTMAQSIATVGKPATVEEVSAACTKAGVPKSDGTISTIISDFMQSYLAMVEAGLVKAL